MRDGRRGRKQRVQSLDDVVESPSRSKKRGGAGAGRQAGAKRRRSNGGGAPSPAQALAKALETVQGDPLSEHMEPCRYADHQSSGNCANNPNCLFGLGERGQGVWAAAANAKAASGAPPKARDTGPGGKPAGLLNLGATCYVNALLQTLFANPVVRRLVYEWEPAETTDQGERQQNERMREMQNVFAHLQEGHRHAHDPRRFAELMSLQTAIQQDAQEFNKLLLNYIDKVVDKHANSRLKKLLQLFQGKQEYVTTCGGCKRESRREATFHELDLQIKGMAGLDQCIERYGEEEHLDGHNKYFCSYCDAKHDATRCTQIAALPDVLNVQLMRFVYDATTYQKKKLKDAVAIPAHLDFALPRWRKMLSPPLQRKVDAAKAAGEDEAFRYRLTAVLHHKGQSANSGHYTADILDRFRGDSWWSFDDTKVEPIETPPEERAASRNAYMLVFERMAARRVTDVGADFPVPLPDPVATAVRASNEALMQEERAKEQKKAAASASAERRRAEYAAIMRRPGSPPFLSRAGKEGASAGEPETGFWVPSAWLRNWVVGFRPKEKRPQRSASGSNGGKNDVVNLLDSTDDEAEAQAKSEAKDSAENGVGRELFQMPPDTKALLCPHSVADEGVLMLRPSNVAKMKRVSARAYKALLESCGVSEDQVLSLPAGEVPSPLVCEVCKGELTRSVELELVAARSRARIEEILASESPVRSKVSTEELGTLVYLSRSWAAQWRRYAQKQQAKTTVLINKLQRGKSNERAKAADSVAAQPDLLHMLGATQDAPPPDINAEITCEHGALKPGQTGRRLIPLADWQFLEENALQGACLGRSKTFRADMPPCSVCSEQLASSREAQRSLKEERHELLQSAEHGAAVRALLKRKRGHPNLKLGALPAGTYYLVPRAWMSVWREYLGGATGKPKPGPVCAAVNATLACSHRRQDGGPLVVVHPRMLLWLKRADSHQAASLLPADQVAANDVASDYVELVTDREWAALEALFPGPVEGGRVEGGSGTLLPSTSVSLSSDLLLADGPDASCTLTFEPPLCEVCMASRASAHADSQSTFTDHELAVVVLPEGAPAPTGQAAPEDQGPQATLTPGASRRSRRRRGVGPKAKTGTVTASSSMSLLMLILSLMERGLLPQHVQPAHVRVYRRGKRLPADTTLTLAACGVEAGEQLCFQVGSDASADAGGGGRGAEGGSIAEWTSLLDVETPYSSAPETGFLGTALTGGPPRKSACCGGSGGNESSSKAPDSSS